MSSLIISSNLVTDNKVNFFSVQFSGSTQRNLKTNSIDSVRTFELSDFLEHSLVENKQQAPLFSPVTWINTSDRCIKANVETVNAMVLDFDKINDDELATVLEQLQGLLYVGYSSFSHKTVEDKNCLRIILPVDRAMTQDEFTTVWKLMYRILPTMDKSCKDPSRRWFMPSTTDMDKADFWVSTEQSEEQYILSVDKFLSYEDRPTTETTTASEPDGEQAEQPQEIPPPHSENDRFTTEIVNAHKHMVRCHDLVDRPFTWVIDNWNSLPLQLNGNYNCCRPSSQTIGSAFVMRQTNSLTGINTYRLVSAPNRTIHISNTTDYGVMLRFSERGASPIMDGNNIAKMLSRMDLNAWECERTGIAYLGSERLRDKHYSILCDQFIAEYAIAPNTSAFREGLDTHIKTNTKNHLRDRLESLQWDGVTRVETIFTTLFGTVDTPLVRHQSRKWFISAVARALQMGCKADAMLILKGKQGAKKSTFAKLIAGVCPVSNESYFCDEPISFAGRDTDSKSQLRLGWIYEIAELGSMNKAEVSECKQFLAKDYDEYRAKYARKEEHHKRGCVFIGTVNDSSFLKDHTGSRRFWVVECGDKTYEHKDLLDIRDQLWAEAVHYYKSGEQWHMDDDMQALSEDNNTKYTDIDIHYSLVENWVSMNSNRTFVTANMIEEIYNETYIDQNGEERKRPTAIKPKAHTNWYAEVLKKLGCEQKNNGKPCKVNGVTGRYWVAPIIEAPEIVTVSKEEYAVEFNDNGTIKSVTMAGQNKVLFEDMSQEQQDYWSKRYPKIEPRVRKFEPKQERMFR